MFSVGKIFFLLLLEVLKKLIFCVMQKSALRNNCPFQHKYKPGTISASSMTFTYYEPQHAQEPPMYASQGSHLYISGGHQFQENDVKTRLCWLARQEDAINLQPYNLQGWKFLITQLFKISLKKVLKGNKIALAQKYSKCLLPCFIWDLHKVLAISDNEKLRTLGGQPWLTPGESGN